MSRAYLKLFVVVLVLGAALAILARLPRHPAPSVTPDAPPPRAAISLTLDAAGRLLPEQSRVPKGSDVTLSVLNGGSAVRTLTLAGYETEIHLALPPGETTSATFRVDRPGDDFAWLVDGEPAGKLAVTGSHLVEGHR